MSGQIDRRSCSPAGWLWASWRPSGRCWRLRSAAARCPARSARPGPWRQARGALDEILRLNFLPFWRRVVDESRGEGYDLNHDAKGRWLGPAQFALVAQARTCWFFAHLVRRGLADGSRSGRAQRGFAVLTSRFVDQVHGGFFWSLGANTYKPERIDKQLYGQSFALFALSEYALASGSPAAAMAAAHRIRGHRCPHARCGRELLRVPAARLVRTARRLDRLSRPAGGHPQPQHPHPPARGVDHLSSASASALARARLADVVALTEAALERSPVPHFRELDGQPATRQSYGRDVETIHLLLRARARLGRCASPPSLLCRHGGFGARAR